MRLYPRWPERCAGAEGNEHPKVQYAQPMTFMFAGIGGAERAMLEGNWPYTSVNTIEKEPLLIPALQKLEDCRSKRFGGERVELVPQDATDCALEKSQGLVATAPCQDFSRVGQKKGSEGERGKLEPNGHRKENYT